MDTSKLCRSCMKEVASWEKENFNSRIVLMFSFCTNNKVTEDDKLPKQFCYDCVIKIESAYTFITEAQKVNVTLKNIVSRIETSVIVQSDNITKTEVPKNYNLKLTLPEYKLSTVSSYSEPVYENHDVCNKNNFEINDAIDNIQCEDTTLEDKFENDIKPATDSTKIVCPVCKKEFVSKSWFKKHMENVHASQSKYQCVHCSKTFLKLSQLTYHFASHSDERKFACQTCGKRFKRRKQLSVHARSHADVRPFSCDQCSMRFKLKSVLKCHMKVHENEKQYLCSFCGWSFTQAGNLKVHMRTHTGEKPFACAQCPFRAAVASNLRRHERRHRGARLHRCDTCGKRFYDASGLARHSRTHTGELPYACPHCARAFVDSWKRKTHLMRAHRLPLHRIPRLPRRPAAS